MHRVSGRGQTSTDPCARVASGWGASLVITHIAHNGVAGTAAIMHGVKNEDPQAVEQALDAYAKGGFVVVSDDDTREDEADLIIAAQYVTPEKMGFMIRYSSGLICVPMTSQRATELNLDLMVADNTESMRTAFTVSVDAADGVTTGISGRDRARTVSMLAKDGVGPTDFVRPGHVFPLIAATGGLLTRAGHTEAAFTLGELSGAGTTGCIAEIINDDGSMARGSQVSDFASRWDLPWVSIEALTCHLKAIAPSMTH